MTNGDQGVLRRILKIIREIINIPASTITTQREVIIRSVKEIIGVFRIIAEGIIRNPKLAFPLILLVIILCFTICVLIHEEIIYLLIFFVVTSILLFVYFLIDFLSERVRKLEHPVSPGRYFIGIEIGLEKIDYCILDSKLFSDTTYKVKLSDVAKYRYSVKKTLSNDPDEIYDETKKIIKRLAKVADKHDLTPIYGIGIGLPGMVNPRDGMLVNAPCFEIENLIPIVENLTGQIDWNTNPIEKIIPYGMKKIPIEIDNDVRCATRFRWKCSPETQNLICISIGDGLGSGIVVNGKMVYGRNFSAGEAGHTTISSDPKFFKKDIKRCHCGNKGHHWEMYASRYGMLNMAKKLNLKKFKKFEEEYLKQSKPLTIDIVREAYLKGNPYASEIVDEFFKYTAIGVANYINILNPEEIIIGGEMIRVFYDIYKKENTLWRKIKEYAIPYLAASNLVFHCTEKQYTSCVGAALIFKDHSYFEYKNRQ